MPAKRITQEAIARAIAKIKAEPGISESALGRYMHMDHDGLMTALTNADHHIYGGYRGCGVYYDENQEA